MVCCCLPCAVVYQWMCCERLQIMLCMIFGGSEKWEDVVWCVGMECNADELRRVVEMCKLMCVVGGGHV